MTSEEVQQQINELERMRSEMRWWRLGSTVAILLITVVCVATIANSVRGLVQQGPRQEVFVEEITNGVQTNVVPTVQSIAMQTVAEMRPEVEQELNKLNDRAPEVMQAAVQELDTLQKSLPESGEKAFNDTFGAKLKEKEPKIREMFPNATDENINKLMDNLAEVGQERIVIVSDKLFSQHIDALNNIVRDMEVIRHTEATNVKGEGPSWEMAILLLDIIREDLKDLEPKKAAGDGTAAPPGPKKDAKQKTASGKTNRANGEGGAS